MDSFNAANEISTALTRGGNATLYLAMVSRDYTQEVGLPSGQKTVSKPIAVVVLVILLAGAWYAVKTLATTHHAAEAPPVEATQAK